MLYQISRDARINYESLKAMDELEFWHLVPAHEKRMELEAKYPRSMFF